MWWLWNGFAVIGAILVSLFLWQLVQELVRAFRQGRRLAYVYARARGDRKPPLKWIIFMAKGDILSSYGLFGLSRGNDDPGTVRRIAYSGGFNDRVSETTHGLMPHVRVSGRPSPPVRRQGAL